MLWQDSKPGRNVNTNEAHIIADMRFLKIFNTATHRYEWNRCWKSILNYGIWLILKFIVLYIFLALPENLISDTNDWLVRRNSDYILSNRNGFSTNQTGSVIKQRGQALEQLTSRWLAITLFAKLCLLPTSKTEKYHLLLIHWILVKHANEERNTTFRKRGSSMTAQPANDLVNEENASTWMQNVELNHS